MLGMLRLATYSATFTVLLCPGVSQTPQPRKTLNVHVEITTDRKDYMPGTGIGFTAVLINGEDRGVYVSKSRGYMGGGIAGFAVEVKQLTGKPSGEGCVQAGDRFFNKDTRPPEQILDEDYLLLPLGARLVMTDFYNGCVVKYPGTYQITATYYANDWNLGKVRSLEDKKERILTGHFTSEPVTFRVVNVPGEKEMRPKRVP
jgi:hypothetical protein